jgi:hypothetical protein
MCLAHVQRLRAPQPLAELGETLERFLTDDQLAAEASICHVARTPAESRSTVVRRARDKNLRAAITCLADNSSHARA